MAPCTSPPRILSEQVINASEVRKREEIDTLLRKNPDEDMHRRAEALLVL